MHGHDSLRSVATSELENVSNPNIVGNVQPDPRDRDSSIGTEGVGGIPGSSSLVPPSNSLADHGSQQHPAPDGLHSEGTKSNEGTSFSPEENLPDPADEAEFARTSSSTDSRTELPIGHDQAQGSPAIEDGKPPSVPATLGSVVHEHNNHNREASQYSTASVPETEGSIERSSSNSSPETDGRPPTKMTEPSGGGTNKSKSVVPSAVLLRSSDHFQQFQKSPHVQAGAQGDYHKSDLEDSNPAPSQYSMSQPLQRHLYHPSNKDRQKGQHVIDLRIPSPPKHKSKSIPYTEEDEIEMREAEVPADEPFEDGFSSGETGIMNYEEKITPVQAPKWFPRIHKPGQDSPHKPMFPWHSKPVLNFKLPAHAAGLGMKSKPSAQERNRSLSPLVRQRPNDEDSIFTEDRDGREMHTKSLPLDGAEDSQDETSGKRHLNESPADLSDLSSKTDEFDFDFIQPKGNMVDYLQYKRKHKKRRRNRQRTPELAAPSSDMEALDGPKGVLTSGSSTWPSKEKGHRILLEHIDIIDPSGRPGPSGETVRIHLHTQDGMAQLSAKKGLKPPVSPPRFFSNNKKPKKGWRHRKFVETENMTHIKENGVI